MSVPDKDNGAKDTPGGSLKDGLNEAKKALQETGLDDKGKTGSGVLRGLGTLASLGITLVAATFIGLVIGIYLDKYFHTAPWLTIIFLLFGIAAGFKNMYSLAKKYGLWSD